MNIDFFDRLQRLSEEHYVVEFEENLSKIDPIHFSDFYQLVQTRLRQVDFVGGVSLFTIEGDQPLIIAKNTKISEDFKTVKNTICSLQPQLFFQALPDNVVLEGLGHIHLNYFEIIFVKVNSDNVFAVMIIDEIGDRVTLLSNFVDELRNQLLKSLSYSEATTKDTISSDSSRIQEKVNLDEKDEVQVTHHSTSSSGQSKEKLKLDLKERIKKRIKD